ncbi:HAD family hydrolase [Catellatospora citrea]|uniref:HAD family hydrolase n=1 Tax=Catellatospora citrea TaxID=53366 RepID=UPI0011C3AAC9|nr:hypothetical protein [Catellatospora citrea]
MLLDFDGLMFDVAAALGADRREQAVAELLRGRGHRPRPVPITFGWYGVHQTLAYLATHEPDHAVEAEVLVSRLELDAALTAQPATNLGEVLTACANTRRAVAVISDFSEEAVLATLKAHGLEPYVNAVAARQGLDLEAAEAGRTVERAAELLGVPTTACLAVSGAWVRLRAARSAGATGLGCVSGRDSRKHLAGPDIPVVSNLRVLSEAMLLH